MDSILKTVVESYPKFHIKKRKSPSYVQMYLIETKNDDIVLVYAMNKSSSGGTDVCRKDSNKCETEELELTGSPLKLDLSLHIILDDTLISDEPQLWSKEEASHGPINIDTARDIANLFNKHRNEQSTENVLAMWILTVPTDSDKPLLLTVQSDKEHFARGIVNYVDNMCLDEIDMDNLIQEYAHSEGINENVINIKVDCKYLISGISYGSHSVDELLNAPHGGVTELACDWSTKTLETPFISCNVNFEQEVIVGHLASPCNAIWKSVCALHNINQVLVDMNAAGSSSVDLNTLIIKDYTPGTRRPNNAKRLKELLNETETYAFTAEFPAGGCICINEDTSNLSQCLTEMCAIGSSNDFTYKLWDVLKDCEKAQELVTLLLEALKFISSGKIRPFIHVDNKTYLSKLVLKLSRGHSQAGKVLQNLRSSPPQALSLVAQVGIEKTMWEYTRVMSLLEHSFFMSSVWSNDARTHETVEQINQTIQDMTMMGGDFTLNPFESLSGTDHSIRLDCEPLSDEDPHELTIDVFTSLKKRGLVTEKKDVHEVPIIADEIDISPWKHILTKFAQLHVCLEHAYRAENILRTNFSSLKQMSIKFLEHYVSDRSPIKTVGQLLSDPVQKITIPIANNIVENHLKKPALWYRVELKLKENTDSAIKRDYKVVHVFSQQSVFPPSVWQNSEQPAEELAEVTTLEDKLKYHWTKYTYISNKLINKLPI